MKTKITDVIVGQRFRKDMGDLSGLAESMRKNGQLQQIGITPDNHLVYGGRRLEAAKLLGWTDIDVKEVDCDLLLAEQDENVVRKAFTVSEQLAIAAALELKLKGRHGGNRKSDQDGQLPVLIDKGESRELAATKAGLGSARTMAKANQVIQNGTPELIEAMDSKAISIHAAANLSRLPKEDQATVLQQGKEAVKQAVKAAEPTPPSKPTSKPKLDESRLYEEGSLSAFLLAARAVRAISQIAKNDPNALAALQSIQVAIDQQLTFMK